MTESSATKQLRQATALSRALNGLGIIGVTSTTILDIVKESDRLKDHYTLNSRYGKYADNDGIKSDNDDNRIPMYQKDGVNVYSVETALPGELFYCKLCKVSHTK